MPETSVDTEQRTMGAAPARQTQRASGKNIFETLKKATVIRFSNIVASSLPVLQKPTLESKLMTQLTRPNLSFTACNALVDKMRKADPAGWQEQVKNKIQGFDRPALATFAQALKPGNLRGCDRQMLSVLLNELETRCQTESLQFPSELKELLADMKGDKNPPGAVRLEELSRGAVNTVYKFTENGKVYVFKPDPSELKVTTKVKERLFGTAVASGIPPGAGAHLPHRAVASDIVAKLLNPQASVSVETNFAVINGQRGIVMELAGGESPVIESRMTKVISQLSQAEQELVGTFRDSGDLQQLARYLDAEFVEIKNDTLTSVKFASGFDPANAATAEGLVDLQIMDIITGQCDRHPGNYKVAPDGSVKAIDNDCSFGVNAIPDKVDVRGQRALMGFIPNNGSLMLRMPPVVNEAQKQRINDLYNNRTELKKQLGPHISDAEIAATMTRLEKLHAHINSNACYVLSQGDNFLSPEAVKLMNPDNSYWAREVMVLNPGQKGGWNNLRKSYLPDEQALGGAAATFIKDL